MDKISVVILPVPGLNEAPRPDYETLRSVRDSLKGKGVHIVTRGMAFDAAHSPISGYLEDAVEITPALAPVLVAGLGVWLARGNSRKLRLKTKDVEVEAQTMVDIDAFLKRVGAASVAVETDAIG